MSLCSKSSDVRSVFHNVSYVIPIYCYIMFHHLSQIVIRKKLIKLKRMKILMSPFLIKMRVQTLALVKLVKISDRIPLQAIPHLQLLHSHRSSRNRLSRQSLIWSPICQTQQPYGVPNVDYLNVATFSRGCSWRPIFIRGLVRWQILGSMQIESQLKYLNAFCNIALSQYLFFQ